MAGDFSGVTQKWDFSSVYACTMGIVFFLFLSEQGIQFSLKVWSHNAIFHQIYHTIFLISNLLSTKTESCDNLSWKQNLKVAYKSDCVPFSIDFLVRIMKSKWLYQYIVLGWEKKWWWQTGSNTGPR